MATITFPDDFTATDPTKLLGAKEGTPNTPSHAAVDQTVGRSIIASSTAQQGRQAVGIPYTDASDIGGVIPDEYSLGTAVALRYTDAASNLELRGITDGYDGRRLTVYATDVAGGGLGTLTIMHQSALASAANRIVCPAETDVVISNYEGVDLVYFKSRWHVISSY
jgi:hypothetical protein